MKKLFTLFVALVCGLMSFAQGITFQLSDGTVVENGSEIIVAGHDDPDAMELHSGLYVKNLTSTQTGLYVKAKAVSGNVQICFGGTCSPLFEGTETEKMGIITANEVVDLQIGANTFMETGYITRKIEVTAWLANAEDEKITATVTFTNDPTLSIENSEVKAHTVYAKDNVLYYNFPYATNRQLQVYNVAGNLCQNIRLTSEAGALHMEGMSKGIYLYRIIEGGNKGASGKLLVK